MSVGVGASGVLGWAEETTPGVYAAPTKFAVLRSESLNYQEDKIWRRPLRGIADVAGVIGGNVHVAGDIAIELTPSQLPLLMKAMRMTVVKTGAGPYTYTGSGSAVAVPTKTISITVVRNGVVFGFTGCVVSSQAYTVEDGMLVGTFGIIGRDEAVQTAPTPTYTTDIPFGMGEYDIQIPTATQIFDMDTFTLSIDDGAEPQYRLKNTGRGAQFVKYGERTVELSCERDFFNRTEFDAYKASTALSVRLRAVKGAESVQWTLPAAIRNSYEISGLSGQADLIRASITYAGTYDSVTSKSYELVVASAENVVFP